MSLKEKYLEVKADCDRFGAHLVVVTKNQPIEKVEEIISLGQRDLAENRVQNLIDRMDYFKSKNLHLKWHLIGPIQSNKWNKLHTLKGLVAIHSVDRQDFVEWLWQKWQGSDLDVYLQYNTSQEEAKSGFETETDLKSALDFIAHHPHPKLKLKGLMTMGTLRTDHQDVEALRCFHELARLKKVYLPEAELSMGMSQDYLLALQCGAGVVRIGSKLF